MPKIQLAPGLTLVPTLTAEDYLAAYSLLGFKENDLGFIPTSLLVPSSSSGWKALITPVGASCEYLHLITVQELTDLILVIADGSSSTKLYASLNNTAWDQETTTALDYYMMNLSGGAYSFQDANEYLTLRADACDVTEANNVQRLRISGTIALSSSLLFMFYKGFIETPAFYLEEIPQ